MNNNGFMYGVLAGTLMTVAGFTLNSVISEKPIAQPVAKIETKYTQVDGVTGAALNVERPMKKRELSSAPSSSINMDGEYLLTSAQEAVVAKIKEFSGITPTAIAQASDGTAAFDIQNSYTYIPANGENIFVGNMIRTEDFFDYNLLFSGEKAFEAVKDLSIESTVTYKAKGEVKGTLYAWTDFTCPYCQQLHNEIPKMNEAGYNVVYLPFPRDLDIQSSYASYSSAAFANALCETDKVSAINGAFEKAKTQKPNEGLKEECRPQHDFVKASMEAGLKSGVTGTPGMIFEKDGKALFNVGYIPFEGIQHMFNGLK